MLKRLFRQRPAERAGKALYLRAVERARTPALYLDLAVPDTVEGRFELYSLHVYLLLERLKGQGEQAAEVAQSLFDAYAKALDDALREMGVGDMAVGKKMRKLGEAFYGRVKSYEVALGGLPDRAALDALLARTVYDGHDTAPGPLGDYVLRQREHLAARPLERFLAGEADWSAE